MSEELSGRKITLAHGSGGAETAELIKNIFFKAYGNDFLSQAEDAALLSGCGRLAMTTDSFVVDPVFFPGGDIGRLAVCGTVNDLLTRGAVPKYLSAGFIIEEGFETDRLEKIAKSMAETAKEAGIGIVTGDTKVIGGSGGIYINTTGVGFIPESMSDEKIPCSGRIQTGDRIILSGNLGDHHAAILSKRLGFENDIASDVAPLVKMTEAVAARADVHAMRDVTRGGLATILSEIAEKTGKCLEIEEDKLPVSAAVRSFSALLGLDPLYMGNEGKMVFFVPENEAEEVLDIIRKSPYGENAGIIGQVKEASDENEKGRLVLLTEIGGRRSLAALIGEGLPRIC